MGTAFWSRRIAHSIGHGAAEEAFTGGLLHDMGKALMHRFFKSELLNAVELAERESIELSEAKQQILDTDLRSCGRRCCRSLAFTACADSCYRASS
jgi:HD-like signal output (HDOD) protein